MRKIATTVDNNLLIEMTEAEWEALNNPEVSNPTVEESAKAALFRISANSLDIDIKGLRRAVNSLLRNLGDCEPPLTRSELSGALSDPSIDHYRRAWGVHKCWISNNIGEVGWSLLHKYVYPELSKDNG